MSNIDISQASVFRSKRKAANHSAAHTRLVNEILEVFWAFGAFAWPTKVGASMLPSGAFVRFGIKGMADVCALPQVRWSNKAPFDNASVKLFIPTWVEAKTGSGEQDEYQISFQKDVERRGHRYILCRDSRELDALFKP